ncbi:MAG: HAMP domain-containing protein [Candidatus Marithrix sp.]|nr:HAMP domain-containing protein [Candidatus Marithrix sp.]
MSFITLKNRLNAGLILGLFGILLISLLMIVSALKNSEYFAHLYSILLLINIVALVTLVTLVIFNLSNFIRQSHRIGARLTIRLVSLLVILSIIPVIIVYYFSLEFLHQRLDNWFDINVEHALTDAFELSQATIDARMREAKKQTLAIAEEITFQYGDMTLLFNELREKSGALELTLLTSSGRVILSNNADTLLPNHPRDSILFQLKQSDNYIGLEPIAGQGLYIRVIIKLSQIKPVRLLQAIFPIPIRIRELAENVENAYNSYKERAYLYKPLRMSSTLVLSLVLLLSIFSTIWIAFFVARRLIAPLNHLIEGTIAVAEGDYTKKLPITSMDELGILVQSFNDMTDKIAQARDEVKRSQQLANSQRAYLEIVLERLSSGVISLDMEMRLRTANPAAAMIMELPLNELLGQTLTQLQKNYPILHPLCTAIYPYLSNYAQDWRKEISIFGVRGRKTLICQGTQLQLSDHGYVIVFDDVTTLIQAQRNAAWSEVAQRLAHEIKNPLTPIQLSAERLRYKYLKKLPPDEVNLLDRMTHTIIQQVAAMKDMVNDFSNYAKAPSFNKESINLNQLIEEVYDLYRNTSALISINLEPSVPNIEADRGHLRQVLHNLIKNALEAQTTDNKVNISTNYLKKHGVECIELRLSNQGAFIPESLMDKIFEPYVTTKTKGTGLGLAIVKKIIDEHNGTVWIEQDKDICVIIRLPVADRSCRFIDKRF